MQPLPGRRYLRLDRTSPAPALPAIALERVQTDDSTDKLTRDTVNKMCALIRDSATDPIVKQCAAYAKKHFSCGSDDPAALAWGVFWYVKHCVKFRSDEGTMMQIGERALELLTAPAVLVRMQNPSEDCDGFTMLSAAMLTILGVRVLVTTVATDIDDPRRWSHVFLVAIINGRVMPLDTSHGKAPGWMVPRDRINRFQTWTLDGRPGDVKIPNYQGLHGYVSRGRGLGAARMPRVLFRRGRGFAGLGCETTDAQGNIFDDGEPCGAPVVPSPPAVDCSSFAMTPAQAAACGFPGGTGPGSGSYVPPIPLNVPLTPAQAGLTPAQQAQLIAQIGNSTVQLIRTASGGPYQVAGTNLVYNPATGQLSNAGTGFPNLSASFNSLGPSIMNNLPLIGGALLALLVLPSLIGGRK